ncbi:hypothetical protein [Rhodopseudomonas sp.]|uniref:hypothetical protein n=1 Tax=Rhodopseudomonas sp. TaxID=1078 RepID=UPI003B3BE5D9
MKPVVLSIDDDEREVAPLVPDETLSLRVVDPNSESLPKQLAEWLPKVSLILLDQKFNENADPLSIKASDGSSFVAHLRSWSRRNKTALAPIVLFTNDADSLKNEIPSVGAAVPLEGSFEGKEHLLSPSLDVEWILYKIADDAPSKIQQLVDGFTTTQKAAGKNGLSLEELENLLSIPSEKDWTANAKTELRAARAPISQLDEQTEDPFGPTQALRWLCHRALPYPGLVLSDLYAAWALGISPEALQSIGKLEATTSWLKELKNVEYVGPLQNFMGRRWWRAGIDYLVWELDKETQNQGSREKAWEAVAPGANVSRVYSTSGYVVTWTPELSEQCIADINICVQLKPPGWPAEALEPWILESDLENNAVLRAMTEFEQ